MKSPYILNFFDISKRFKNKSILNSLNLDILNGEIIGIVGESGCGKSTLLKTLFGFITIDYGHIMFNGEDITHNLKAVRTNIGFATQEDTFYPKLTVKENMNYYGRLYGLNHTALEARTESLLQLFKLGGNKEMLSENLSGGMKKRLCLAISLIHNPEVFLLDEPTVGLDPMLRDEIWTWIKKINELGKTVIVVSHLFEELEKNCHRVAIMSNGKILTVGKVGVYKRLWPGKTFNEIFDFIIKRSRG